MSILKSSVFILIIGGFFALILTLTPPGFIQSERRPPARFPAVNPRDISSGEFMEDFERAATDNYPFREQFRALKAAAVFGVFMQTDKNGLYADEYGVGMIKPVDAESVKLLTEKINGLVEGLPGTNVYYSFIPDKSVYAGKTLPGFDSATVREFFAPAGEFIDITETLNAGSFYRTDLHWDQTKIKLTAETLVSAMRGAEPDGFRAYLQGLTELSAGDFQGVYAGQMALPVGGDAMNYYNAPELTALYLNSSGTGFERGGVYDAEKFAGNDPYDLFLRGAQPLLIIENAAPATDRELFIFRDSFASSLAPLLAWAYARVTLIDLRYADMATVRRLTDIPPGADILFLYSSQILNNAGTLLV